MNDDDHWSIDRIADVTIRVCRHCGLVFHADLSPGPVAVTLKPTLVFIDVPTRA